MTDSKAPRRDYLTRFQVKGGRLKGRQVSLRPWAEDEAFLQALGPDKSEWIREVIHAAIVAEQTKSPRQDGRG
jgi:hypothetical protein